MYCVCCVLSAGMSVVRQIEGVATDGHDKPTRDVVVAACGVLPVETPYAVAREEARD